MNNDIYRFKSFRSEALTSTSSPHEAINHKAIKALALPFEQKIIEMTRAYQEWQFIWRTAYLPKLTKAL